LRRTGDRAGGRAARRALGTLAAALPSAALAHGGSADPASLDWLHGWSAPPGVVAPLALAAALYAGGAWRLWRRAGVGRGLSRAQAAAFAAGCGALAIALLSPLDALTGAYFSWHMAQHMLLIVVASPLLVLGAPEVAFLWALPARWRGAVGRREHALARAVVGAGDGTGRGPVLVLALATGVLWIWHAPLLYALAAAHDGVHTAEHVGFVATSVLFWATVLRVRPRERFGNGLRVLYVFAMALQGAILGALLTFAAVPLYASHAAAARALGIDALADQQVAGLIMWVPPGFLYIGVMGYLFMTWLAELEARRRTGAIDPPGAPHRAAARRRSALE
jgi:putative membrane protein